jgi:Peptidase_C39 like family
MTAITLKITNTTWLKMRLAQSAALPEADKRRALAGSTLAIQNYQRNRDHYAVRLVKPIDGRLDWFVFCKDATIDGGAVGLGAIALPSSKLLEVPYKNQRNNQLNPDGACNVSCVAMVLLYLGIESKGEYPQFEDELYAYTEDNSLNRHEPIDLSRLMQRYGIANSFDSHSSIEAVKAQIAGGNPAILHGYFTQFGHIITAIGYDRDGLIVNDPYGEWNNWGYDRNSWENGTKGKRQNYSYALIESACMPDGNLWAHFPRSL